MSAHEIPIEALRTQIKEQGDQVRKLKNEAKDQIEITKAIESLEALRICLHERVNGSAEQRRHHDSKLRTTLDALMKSRFIIVPSFEIYNAVAGLYDYGPIGTGIKDNILSLWRQHFVIHEQMLEVSCAALTLSTVLKSSGHVDRFTDLMVRDVITGDAYRADHLLEAAIDEVLLDVTLSESERTEHMKIRGEADAISPTKIDEYLIQYGVKSPDTGNDLSKAFPFNLMFGTQIGPTGRQQGYLRPETAQGIFTNFKRLIDYRGGKMPFAAAQIGIAFRNEIAPRSGLLRVREFCMAEIEHFVHPQRKQHSSFDTESSSVLRLLSAINQANGHNHIECISIADAVSSGMINNETLAYFMARTQRFLHLVGIDPERLRFRQHRNDEMAHYASDCWDAEIDTTYGWVECVGHADRSCFDLNAHSKFSGNPLCAYERYDSPKQVEVLKRVIQAKTLGMKFRNKTFIVKQFLEEVSAEKAMNMQKDFDKGNNVSITLCDNNTYTLDSSMVSFSMVTEKQSGETYTPAVIEPSFGIGRIVYCILEHSLYVRDPNEKVERPVLKLKPTISPTKVTVLPLSNKKEFEPFTSKLVRALSVAGVSSIDESSSASIGRRYSRCDEIGVPFAVTIDFDTVTTQSVTIRERDSMTQIRCGINEVVDIIKKLISEEISWTQAQSKYENFVQQQDSKSICSTSK